MLIIFGVLVNIAKPCSKKCICSAYQMDFDSKVSEDAMFQYAKLSYELGNPYEPPQLVLHPLLTGSRSP